MAKHEIKYLQKIVGLQYIVKVEIGYKGFDIFFISKKSIINVLLEFKFCQIIFKKRKILNKKITYKEYYILNCTC